MLKSLFPWKHNKTKVMATEQTMMNEAPGSPSEQTLLPCHVCNRTFMPTPLKKHVKICEANAKKKRKVFNSLKQRVQGTDLAQFHQTLYLKKTESTPAVVEPSKNKWKEKHLELVNTIRAAKGIQPEMNSTPKKTQSQTPLTSMNERCPSCDRQFGPKAFDRHVEWCKEHKARIQKSPANIQLAKERLEARIKYKVPPLKQSRRSLTREKYSPQGNKAESVASTKSSSTISLGAAPNLHKNKSVSTIMEKKLEAPKRDGEQLRVDRCGDACENDKPSYRDLAKNVAKADASKHNNAPWYDPFETAQRQFMELLQTDDTQSFSPSDVHKVRPHRPHTTTNSQHIKQQSPKSSKKIKSADTSNKSSQRSSLVDPSGSFKEALEYLQDDFEFIENLINDHFSDKNMNDEEQKHEGFFLHLEKNNNRKDSDDISSIDPSLINENDNLSIPDHFKVDDISPTSTEATLQNEEDIYSLQYDKKISSIEPPIMTKSLCSPAKSDKTVLKRSVSALTDSKRKSPNLIARNIRNVSDNKSKNSNSSAIREHGSKKGSKSLASMKHSKSLFETSPKPPSLKNRDEANNYFNINSKSPDGSGSGSSQVEEAINESSAGEFYSERIKAEELFSVDDVMYEEFKKYEELYLKEKDQKHSTKKHRQKNLDMNFGISTTEDDYLTSQNNKICNDSAYGSLSRKTEKINETTASKKSHKDIENLHEETVTSEAADTSTRMSKFCHECGNRYPITSAKFCVECGVRRLVL